MLEKFCTGSMYIVIPFCIPLIFFPKLDYTQTIAKNIYILIISLSMIYIYLLFNFSNIILDNISFPLSVEKLRLALSYSEISLLIWFLLLIGNVFTTQWIFFYSMKRNYNCFITSLIIIITLILGHPVGIILQTLRQIFMKF